MNALLDVSLQFEGHKNAARGFSFAINADRGYESSKIDELIYQLNNILYYYKDNYLIDGCLVDAKYVAIISKSGRISEIFKEDNVNDTNDLVRGARFALNENQETCHVITYYISKENIGKTIENLKKVKEYIDIEFNGTISPSIFNKTDKNKIHWNHDISKNKLLTLIVDCSNIESFSVPDIKEQEYEFRDNTITLTFFNTEKNLDEVCRKINIDHHQYSKIDSNTISVDNSILKVFMDKVPYLISMASCNDISQLPNSKQENNELNIEIPVPTNEPTIGVIDSIIDKENLYFKEWIEYEEKIDPILDKKDEDSYSHGTKVSSIIVDGPRLNPWLDDNCGRFKVKHFGVFTNKIAMPTLIRRIKDIVRDPKNSHIKVYNLCIGSEYEISNNFISYDAAILDELQREYKIIFVISGTNDNRIDSNRKTMKIGSPADSLNALVVGSVRKDNAKASYSRTGPVLSFFNKPDVSYYGGDYDERINVCDYNNKLTTLYGTSIAAPWIARKLCYLIDVLRLPIEIAKALIIDSAAGWNYVDKGYKEKNIKGFGVVPIKIDDIVNSQDDEIRFVVRGETLDYTTAFYAIPVPLDEDKTMYIGRATMCYFPKCNRLEGVDYTQNELSFKFGYENLKGEFKDSIGNNIQDEDKCSKSEKEARQEFRKWDNTKFFSEIDGKNRRGRKLLLPGHYGITVTRKSRSRTTDTTKIPFGIVITLKHSKGKNYYVKFRNSCSLNLINTTQIEIKNKLELKNEANEILNIDD